MRLSIFSPIVALSLLFAPLAHADKPPPATCTALYAGACMRFGVCTSVCGTWCGGGTATTACKMCVVTNLDPEWDACYADPPPTTCCGSIQACTSSTVASLCEEEEHVTDCGAADCMTCCTETASGCTFTAYCAP